MRRLSSRLQKCPSVQIDGGKASSRASPHGFPPNPNKLIGTWGEHLRWENAQNLISGQKERRLHNARSLVGVGWCHSSSGVREARAVR
ncbi:hypothetical protein COCOBI_07-6440 [Coccomyxa sp. Obi]|nr:hypothetical protein COCOBI_07-6440 [Coccomyxa sp. Obi]